MGRPTSNFGGDRPMQSPLSLHPYALGLFINKVPELKIFVTIRPIVSHGLTGKAPYKKLKEPQPLPKLCTLRPLCTLRLLTNLFPPHKKLDIILEVECIILSSQPKMKETIFPECSTLI